MTEWIVSSVVLIVVVALVRQLLKGKISLRLQYALWAIVLVRLLVPITFGESKISVLNVLDQAASVVERKEPAEEPTVSDPGWEPIGGSPAPIPTVPTDSSPVISELPEPVVPIVPNPSNPVTEPESPAVDEPSGAPLVSVAQLLTPFWLCGIVVVGLWFLFTNLRFWLRLRRSCRVLELDCPIRVYVTGAVETPCLFGLIRPAIYLTPEVAEDEVALRHVLAHELTHYRHWDHVWSVLRCVCLAIHWYNPLVWLAASLSRRDAELACDENTIRRIGEEERTAYGRTLIGLTCVHRSNLLHTATTMTGSKKSIKERIVLIAKKPKMAIYTLIAVILIAAIAVGCTFTGAKKKEGLSRLTKIDKDSITLALINGLCELPKEQYSELADLLHRAAEQPVLKEKLTAEAGNYSDGVEYAMTVTFGGDTCIIGCIPEDDGGAELWVHTFGLGTDPEEYTLYWIEFDELYQFIIDVFDREGTEAEGEDNDDDPEETNDPELPSDPDAELLAYFQDLLTWDGGTTHYNGAMTCVYDSPEDINLEYVFYNRFPDGEEWSDFTEDEKKYLIAEGAKKNLGFGDIPAQKRYGIQLEQALQNYFGVSLSEVQIPNSWVYYKDTNSYYSSHGDTHVMQFFTVTKVERNADGLIYVYYTAEGPIYRQDGTTLDGWEHNMVLTLRGIASIGGSSNGYVVLANQQLGSEADEPANPADALRLMGSELGITLFERTWMPTHTLWLHTNSYDSLQFTALLQLLSGQSWVEVEREVVTTDFRTTFVSRDHTKSLTIYSGSDGQVEYTCGGVTTRWRPVEKIVGADSDYALKAKEVYQVLEYHPNQVVEADDPLTAAKTFVESYGSERLSWSPGHIQKISDYRLLNWGLDEVSADETAVVGWIEFAMMPDGNYDNFMVGGIMEGTGEYEGWVIDRNGFMLVRKDDLWSCCEWGGGMGEGTLRYHGYTPMEEWEIENLRIAREYTICQVDGSETDYDVIARSLAEQYAQCILNRFGWAYGQALDVQVKSTEVFDAYYGVDNPNFCFAKEIYIKITEEQRGYWETGSGLGDPIAEGPYAGYYVHGMEVNVRKLEDGNWHMTGMGTGGASVGLPVSVDYATTKQLVELYFLTEGFTHDWLIVYRLGETPVEEVRECLNELEDQQRQELTEALLYHVTTYPDYAIWGAEDL